MGGCKKFKRTCLLQKYSVNFLLSCLSHVSAYRADGRDKTVKFWDTRTATPAAVVNLCERAYSMDTKGAMMVVATADRKVGRFSRSISLSMFVFENHHDMKLERS